MHFRFKSNPIFKLDLYIQWSLFKFKKIQNRYYRYFSKFIKIFTSFQNFKLFKFDSIENVTNWILNFIFGSSNVRPTGCPINLLLGTRQTCRSTYDVVCSLLLVVKEHRQKKNEGSKIKRKKKRKINKLLQLRCERNKKNLQNFLIRSTRRGATDELMLFFSYKNCRFLIPPLSVCLSFSI